MIPARRVWPIVATLLVAVVVVAALLREAPAAAEARLVSLRLERVGGGATELEQLTGQPVVVNLWASWCGPCRRELPMMARLDRQRPDVTFVFANQLERPTDVRAFLDELTIELDHVVLDPRGELGRAYGSPGLPTTLFFDAEGRLVGRHVGEIDGVTLFNAVVDLVR